MVHALTENCAAVATLERVESATVGIAPFALLRIAALPYTALTELRPRLTREHIDAVLAAERRMETLRQALEDALYAVVPLLDRERRANVLAVRRAVHNGRCATARPELRNALDGQSASTAKLLDEWLAASADASASLALAERALAEETETRLRGGLRQIAANPEFERAIALTSPDLYEAMQRSAGSGGQAASTKLERSILAYAMRAAAKTSPLSTFMHQAVLTVDESQTAALPRLERCARKSRSYLNSGVAYLREAGASADAERYGANPELRWLEEEFAEFVAPHLLTVSGRLWRSEKASRIRLHALVAKLLREMPFEFSWADLMARLAERGLTGERAAGLADKLRAKRVIVPQRAVGQSSGCEDLRFAATQIAKASAADRVVILRRIRRDLGAGEHLAALNPVLEDGGFEETGGAVGRPTLELLTELREALKPAVTIRSHYRTLRDLFVECHGAGGTSDDVVGFLRMAAERLRFEPMPWNGNARIECDALDGARPLPDGRGSGTVSALPPFEDVRQVSTHVEPPALPTAAVTVFLQLSISRGELLGIVNQVHGGCGWLSARHAEGEDASAMALSDNLAQWLRTVKAPKEPVDIPICADCNPLQSHPRISRRSLIWPGETLPVEGALAIRDTVLTHSAASGLLELADRDGVALAPVYLGGTLPTQAWGGRYWLTVLAEPSGIEVPLERLLPPASEAVEFEFRPRHRRGNIVLSRASWWVRSERLTRTWFRNRGARQLADIAADCAEQGIPRVFFARTVLRPSEVGGGDAHKPMWIDTMNPFCLELLEANLKRSEWTAFSEVLPDAAAGWSPYEGSPHVFELLVELTL
jgi:hypothetical protein